MFTLTYHNYKTVTQCPTQNPNVFFPKLGRVILLRHSLSKKESWPYIRAWESWCLRTDELSEAGVLRGWLIFYLQNWLSHWVYGWLVDM